MSIYRIERQERDFTIIGNEALRDERLSWKATGLLTFLLSLPEDWDPKGRDLTKRKRDGRESTFAGLRELEEAGYVERVRERDAQGRIRTVTVVREKPQVRPSPRNPDPVEPGSGDLGLLRSTDHEVPIEEGPKVKNQTLAPTSSSREVDPIFEALFYLETGKVYTEASAKELTSSGRGALNKAAGEIRATGISPADLEAAIMSWPDLFPGAVCTANAVAKHLSRMKMAANGMVARGNGHDSVESMTEKVLAQMKKNDEEGVSWVP